MPNKWFSMIEEKLGIIFACGPAVRQLFAYRSRTGTFLPSGQRQERNEDFNRMRRRITLRDIFWFRPSPLGECRRSNVDNNSATSQSNTSRDIEATAKTSVLDTLWGHLFHALPGVSSRSASTVDTGRLRENKVPFTSSSAAEQNRIVGKYKSWGLMQRSCTPRNSGSGSMDAPFLQSGSQVSGTSETAMGQPPQQHTDAGLSEILADPVRSLVPAEHRLSAIETNRPSNN